jgi:hypothetical protein
VAAAVRGSEGDCGIEVVEEHWLRSFLVEVASRRCCGVEGLGFAGEVGLGSFVAAVGFRSAGRSCSRIEASLLARNHYSLGFVGILDFDTLDSAELDSRSRTRLAVVGILDSAARGHNCLAAEDSGLAVLAVEA